MTIKRSTGPKHLDHDTQHQNPEIVTYKIRPPVSRWPYPLRLKSLSKISINKKPVFVAEFVIYMPPAPRIKNLQSYHFYKTVRYQQGLGKTVDNLQKKNNAQ